MRCAIVQLNSRDDKQHNVAAAIDLATRAARDGADLVALPETFPYCGPLAQAADHAEAIPGPTTQAVGDVAKRHGVHILAGSIHEASAESNKPFNTSVLIGPDGSILAIYRKIHLFDVHGLEIESASIAPGDQPVCVETSLGRLGLTVCYDLRFPELYRELVAQGAELLLVPAAFTLHTGRDHWEVLLRARAIENLAYVIAPNQYGERVPGKHSYGHSMIVDPWGTVVCRIPDGVGIAHAELDLERVRRLRRELPCLNHRRR